MSLMNLDGDLGSCIQYNPIIGIDDETVTGLLAEIVGENDGPSWCWVVSLKDGSFAGIVGGCDYTGWDCRSSACGEFFATAEDAAIWCADNRGFGIMGPESDLGELAAQLQGLKPVGGRMAHL